MGLVPRLFAPVMASFRAALCMAVTAWIARVVRASRSEAFWRSWATEGGVKLPGTVVPPEAVV